jgi:hypothetical protein
MHREQNKCSLRRVPAMSRAAAIDPDFSTFSANLHSARLNLLPHMVFTAVLDACRGMTSGIMSSSFTTAPGAASTTASTRATRR